MKKNKGILIGLLATAFALSSCSSLIKTGLSLINSFLNTSATNCTTTTASDPTSSQPTVVSVTSISLNTTTLSLVEGANSSLTATILPSDATNKNVNWTSTNSSVATVNNGKVFAIKAGSATIIATTADGGHTAMCNVTVSAATVAVTGVSLNKTTAELKIGENVTLTATVSPTNATNKNVTWKSSNTAVASVTNGVVTAVAAGSATITVTTVDGNFKATCTVTVTGNNEWPEAELAAMLDEYEFDVTIPSLDGEYTYELVDEMEDYGCVTVYVEGATEATYLAILEATQEYLIDDSYVDEYGYFAYANDKSHQIQFFVDSSGYLEICISEFSGDDGIYAERNAYVLAVGESVQITYILGLFAEGDVTFSTLATDIVSVSNTGLITAIAVGDAVVGISCGEASDLIDVHVVSTAKTAWTQTEADLIHEYLFELDLPYFNLFTEVTALEDEYGDMYLNIDGYEASVYDAAAFADMLSEDGWDVNFDDYYYSYYATKENTTEDGIRCAYIEFGVGEYDEEEDYYVYDENGTLHLQSYDSYIYSKEDAKEYLEYICEEYAELQTEAELIIPDANYYTVGLDYDIDWEEFTIIYYPYIVGYGLSSSADDLVALYSEAGWEVSQEESNYFAVNEDGRLVQFLFDADEDAFILYTYDYENGGGGGDTDPEPFTVTYNFVNDKTFATWGASYTEHEIEYDDLYVYFASANKQASGQTIDNMPVTKGGDVIVIADEGDEITGISFTLKQWNTKTQVASLYTSDDYGVTWSSTAVVSSSNFSVSATDLPEGTNAVKLSFSSSSNQVGIQSVTVDFYGIQGGSGGGGGGGSATDADAEAWMQEFCKACFDKTTVVEGEDYEEQEDEYGLYYCTAFYWGEEADLVEVLETLAYYFFDGFTVIEEPAIGEDECGVAYYENDDGLILEVYSEEAEDDVVIYLYCYVG